jgi:hypothetical protein
MPSILALDRIENASQPFGRLGRLAEACARPRNRGLNRGRLVWRSAREAKLGLGGVKNKPSPSIYIPEHLKVFARFWPCLERF